MKIDPKILLLFLFLFSCSSKKPVEKEMVFPVKITLVEEKDTPIFIEALGHVEPITSVEIRSRVEGEIVKIYCKEGDEVQRGDPLFEIDPRPYEIAFRQMKALLEQNLANLALAQEKLKRYKILAKEEYYSQIDYETLQANYISTSALVDQNRAQLDQARLNLDYCTITAPITGRLGTLNVTYGNLVSAPDGTSSPLILLNQMDPIYVSFFIPEYLFPKVQRKGKNLCVLASYEDFEDSFFEGNLFMLDNQVDPKTGMVQLKAIFLNDKRALWPGQFLRVRLVLEILEKAKIIPFSAVQMTMQEPIVFVVTEEGKVEERKVELGQRDKDQVIVTKGLKKNEQIVLEGQMNLYDGAKVHAHL